MLWTAVISSTCHLWEDNSFITLNVYVLYYSKSINSSTGNSAALPSSDSESSDEELTSSPTYIKSKPSMEVENSNAGNNYLPTLQSVITASLIRRGLAD